MKITTMTPAQSCRQICGLTLADVSRAVNKHANVLARWHKHNYALFYSVCVGVAYKKQCEHEWVYVKYEDADKIENGKFKGKQVVGALKKMDGDL